MSEEFKMLLVVVVGFVVLVGLVGSCVNENERIEQKAPIVETCVKHPATVSPFKSGY